MYHENESDREKRIFLAWLFIDVNKRIQQSTVFTANKNE